MEEPEQFRPAQPAKVRSSSAQAPTDVAALAELAQLQPPAAAAPQAAPEGAPRPLSPEEKDFMDALTRLFTTAQEFGLTLASIETDVAKLPPDMREVVEQGKEVARAVKNFQRVIKKRMGVA